MKGETLKRFLGSDWIDNLSPAPRILAWVGMALGVVLVVDLVSLAIGDPVLRWRTTGLFVLVGTASGYAGSVIRNRNRNRLDQ